MPKKFQHFQGCEFKYLVNNEGIAIKYFLTYYNGVQGNMRFAITGYLNRIECRDRQLFKHINNISKKHNSCTIDEHIFNVILITISVNGIIISLLSNNKSCKLYRLNFGIF